MVTTRDVFWMKELYFTQPNESLFDIESTLIDTEAKDVEDVIRINDGSEILETEDRRPK